MILCCHALWYLGTDLSYPYRLWILWGLSSLLQSLERSKCSPINLCTAELLLWKANVSNTQMCLCVKKQCSTLIFFLARRPEGAKASHKVSGLVHQRIHSARFLPPGEGQLLPLWGVECGRSPSQERDGASSHPRLHLPSEMLPIEGIQWQPVLLPWLKKLWPMSSLRRCRQKKLGKNGTPISFWWEHKLATYVNTLKRCMPFGPLISFLEMYPKEIIKNPWEVLSMRTFA